MLLEGEERSALLKAAACEAAAARRAAFFEGTLTDGALAESMAQLAKEHTERHAALVAMLEGKA